MSIEYRPFRNTDPPALVELWNESVTGRGAVFLQGVTPFETHVLAKPFFDRNGLIVAVEDGKLAGFVHAGFGPDESGQRLSTAAGVICILAVRASHRRQKVGTELLHRAEAYLTANGATEIYFGAMRPLNPFYLGLYGGSELCGVLVSDRVMERFLHANAYKVWDTCAVLSRGLDGVQNLNDPRFGIIKRKYKLQMQPRPAGTSWYDACVLSPCEMLQFELQDSKSSRAVAKASFWEMDLYSWRWHQSCAGIVEVEVQPEVRRQGMGKFLVVQILRYLQDQFFTQVEVQTMTRNTPALNLYQSLGFQRADEGRVYKLQGG